MSIALLGGLQPDLVYLKGNVSRVTAWPAFGIWICTNPNARPASFFGGAHTQQQRIAFGQALAHRPQLAQQTRQPLAPPSLARDLVLHF